MFKVESKTTNQVLYAMQRRNVAFISAYKNLQNGLAEDF
jgi:hypothetical protein